MEQESTTLGETYNAKNGSEIDSQHAEAVDALFGHTGQERDTATGLQYHSDGDTGRWYDPRTGRWLSEDPIFAPNLYPYVSNDPVNNVDPTGASLVKPPQAIGTLGALGAGTGYLGLGLNAATSALSSRRILSTPLDLAPQPTYVGASYPDYSHTSIWGLGRGQARPDLGLPTELPPATPTGGLLATAWDAAKLFPTYSKASVVATGSGLYEIGANLVSGARDHVSTLWNDPSTEFNRLDDAKYRIERAIKDTTVYAAQHPIQSVINVGTATGNYVNRLTSDPEASGRFGANALAFVAGNEIAAAAGRLAPEWLVGTSRAGRIAGGTTTMAKEAGATTPSSSVVDKTWKTIIEGTPQPSKTPGHTFRNYREAIEMAKSGQYESVYINRSYSTVTGTTTTPRRLPDVLGKRYTGQFDAVEIPSKTDSIDVLIKRNIDAMKQLPANQQGTVRIAPIR